MSHLPRKPAGSSDADQHRLKVFPAAAAAAAAAAWTSYIGFPGRKSFNRGFRGLGFIG